VGGDIVGERGGRGLGMWDSLRVDQENKIWGIKINK